MIWIKSGLNVTVCENQARGRVSRRDAVRICARQRLALPWASDADEFLHLCEGSLCQRLHLGISAILNGMRHVQAVRVKAKCCALGVGRWTKHF